MVPDSDWGFMAVLPDTAPDMKLDIAVVWSSLRALRRLRIEVFLIRRRDFEEVRYVISLLQLEISALAYSLQLGSSHSKTSAGDDDTNYCFLICVDKPDCNDHRPVEDEASCVSSLPFVDGAMGRKACRPSRGS